MVKKPVEAEVRDDEDVEQENEVENGAVEITSDAEDDRRSSDEEVEHAKPVKKAAAKKKSPAAKKEKEPSKECQHMYVKGKNAGTKCTTTVKGEGNYCSKHKSKAA